MRPGKLTLVLIEKSRRNLVIALVIDDRTLINLAEDTSSFRAKVALAASLKKEEITAVHKISK